MGGSSAPPLCPRRPASVRGGPVASRGRVRTVTHMSLLTVVLVVAAVLFAAAAVVVAVRSRSGSEKQPKAPQPTQAPKQPKAPKAPKPAQGADGGTDLLPAAAARWTPQTSSDGGKYLSAPPAPAGHEPQPKPASAGRAKMVRRRKANLPEEAVPAPLVPDTPTPTLGGAADLSGADVDEATSRVRAAREKAEQDGQDARSAAQAAREATRQRKAAAAAAKKKTHLAAKLRSLRDSSEQLKVSLDPEAQRKLEKLAEEEKALREQLRETARAESDAAQAARDAAAAHTAAHLAENSEGAWAAHADAHTLHRRRLMDAAIAAANAANAEIVGNLALPAAEDTDDLADTDDVVADQVVAAGEPTTATTGSGAEIIIDTAYKDYGLPEPLPPRIRLRETAS